MQYFLNGHYLNIVGTIMMIHICSFRKVMRTVGWLWYASMYGYVVAKLRCWIFYVLGNRLHKQQVLYNSFEEFQFSLASNRNWKGNEWKQTAHWMNCIECVDVVEKWSLDLLEVGVFNQRPWNWLLIHAMQTLLRLLCFHFPIECNIVFLFRWGNVEKAIGLFVHIKYAD